MRLPFLVFNYIIVAMEQKLIDGHAHLVSESVDANPIIANMEKDKLEAVVCIGTAPFDIKKVVELANSNKNVFAAIAYHPEYVDKISDDDFIELESLLHDKRVVAVGECGLDYHYSTEFVEEQKQMLKRHILLAEKLNKPIMLHIRDAEKDAIEILKPHVGILKDVIIHCYSAVSEEVTKEFVKMGAYISFAGNFTFKKFRRQDIKLIPLDKLLVETDSPYLSPEPFRGMQNEPKNVHITATAMADELEMNVNELKAILLENAKRVYGI